MELYCCKIKKFLIFSEMELCSLVTFLYFRKEISKLEKLKKKKKRSKNISYIFSKKSLSYILGNGTFLCFLKKFFLHFWKRNFPDPRLKKKSYISGEYLQRMKIKNLKIKYFLSVEREFFKRKHKKKSILCFYYKEAKFSKLKYFLINTIKLFFSF